MSVSTAVEAAGSGSPEVRAAADAGAATAPKATVCNQPLAQILLCKGCCCGHTERGRPAVPVDELKAIWKAEKLNRVVQLTISGCLGPCRLANVALVLSAVQSQWIGGLQSDADYAALVGWARDCSAAGRLAPIPDRLRQAAFERFALEQ